VKTANWLSLLLLVSVAIPASAADPDPISVLADELKAHTPNKWELRVRWRDGQLLASVTPWPYQEAFNLWYDTSKLVDTLKDMCPGPVGRDLEVN
jgi:hypothetical protein